jgi:predicted amino acid-binding ACT domain protein
LLGKILTAAITLFWLAMMALLVNREVLPAYLAAREAARAPNYAWIEALAAKPRVEQLGIFLGGVRIGQTVNRMSRVGDELHLTNRTDLELNSLAAKLLMMGGGIQFSSKFEATVVEARLAGFRMEVLSPPQSEPLAIVDGTSAGDTLKIKIRQGGRVQNLTTPFDSRQVLSGLFSPASMPAQLHVGQSWAVNTLGLGNFGIQNGIAKVLRTERINVESVSQEAFVIQVKYGTYEMTVWANSQGEVLQQKFLGFTLVREKPPAEAENEKKP